MTKIIKTISYIVVSAVVALGLTACNTVQGVGNDLAAGGKALSKMAKKTDKDKTAKKKQG